MKDDTTAVVTEGERLALAREIAAQFYDKRDPLDRSYREVAHNIRRGRYDDQDSVELVRFAIASVARLTAPQAIEASTIAGEGEVNTDTVAFVQEWLMNADYDPSQFDKDFAAAIDARCAALTPAAPAPAADDVRGENERLRKALAEKPWPPTDDDLRQMLGHIVGAWWSAASGREIQEGKRRLNPEDVKGMYAVRDALAPYVARVALSRKDQSEGKDHAD